MDLSFLWYKLKTPWFIYHPKSLRWKQSLILIVHHCGKPLVKWCTVHVILLSICFDTDSHRGIHLINFYLKSYPFTLNAVFKMAGRKVLDKLFRLTIQLSIQWHLVPLFGFYLSKSSTMKKSYVLLLEVVFAEETLWHNFKNVFTQTRWD